MKPGTPGFYGERLRAAREARGITTSSALAEMIGVSRASVSQYERAEQTPSPAVMQLISKTLNLPVTHFLRPYHDQDGVLFFRSLASATKNSRCRAQRKYEWLTEIVHFLRNYVEFPAVDFPVLDVPDDPVLITDDFVEEAASDLRRHWGLAKGPISNVTWLAENKGTIAIRLDLESDKLDAFSRWNPIDNAPYIILGKNRGGAARSRFNAAHEIAHLVLHRHITKTQFSRPIVFKEIERQAHRFAGAFLLPEETFLSELYTVSLDALVQLKPKWKVSVALMLKRAEDLGAIPDGRARSLWMNLARRGWRRSEPLDSSLTIEKPRFLYRCFDMLFQHGLITRDELPERLGMSRTDIEDLANLPHGFTDPTGAEHDVSETEPRIFKFPDQ